MQSSPFVGKERVTKIEMRDDLFFVCFRDLALVVSWIMSFVRAENGRLELENRNITVYCEIL